MRDFTGGGGMVRWGPVDDVVGARNYIIRGKGGTPIK